jgi:hypothetical protein
MAFDIRWIKAGHLLHVNLYDPMTDADAEAFNTVMNEYFEASTRILVHGIFDFSQATSVYPLKRIANFTFPKHHRMGWNVFVGLPNKQVAFILSIATQLFKLRVRNVNTMDEAMEFIQYVDQTLKLE